MHSLETLRFALSLSNFPAGVYADLDFESLRPLDDLLAEPELALGAITHDGDWDQNFPNAWLASVKGHPFWMFCIQQIIKAAGACSAQNTDRCVRWAVMQVSEFSVV